MSLLQPISWKKKQDAFKRRQQRFASSPEVRRIRKKHREGSPRLSPACLPAQTGPADRADRMTKDVDDIKPKPSRRRRTKRDTD